MKVYIILSQHIDSEATAVYAVYRDLDKAKLLCEELYNDEKHSYWIKECEVKE